MDNLNPYFDGIRIAETDLFAFIDESGTECFNTVLSEEWFNVSAIVLKFNTSNLMINTIKSFRDKYRKGSPLHKLSFKDLKHSQRKNLLGMLCNNNYLTIHSSFYKPLLNPNDYTYPNMYFIGIKNVVERLSWLTNQFNFNRVHIVISNKDHTKSENLKDYLFTKSVKADKNLMLMSKIGIVNLNTIGNQLRLLLADYTASSMWHCLEKTSLAKIIENVYFDIFLKTKLFSSNYRKYSGIWSNGFKCIPNNKNLITHNDILKEGSHKL
jgi:hypothetical protein